LFHGDHLLSVLLEGFPSSNPPIFTKRWRIKSHCIIIDRRGVKF
jgi:hypothetical protein